MKRVNSRHVDGDCQLLLKSNHQCNERAAYTMTRADGTTQLLCGKHATRLKRQMAAHPEVFAKARFAQLAPSLQLTKYEDA